MRAVWILLLTIGLATGCETAGTGSGTTGAVVPVEDTGGGGTEVSAGTDVADVCAPACDGRQCGDDGCGGSCGECGEDEVCGGDGTCGPVIGPGDCDVYCDIIQAACGDSGAADSQFADRPACMAWCRDLAGPPGGQTDDPGGNTVGCRTREARLAQVDAPGHCMAAGPTGGGVCGTLCENYCDLAERNCVGQSTLYSERDECLLVCLGIAATGKVGDQSGDSLQCRMNHLLTAGTGGPEAAGECEAGAEGGGGVCGADPNAPTCQQYCTVVQEACGDSGAQTSVYSSQAACMAFCQTWAALPAGSPDDTELNTIGCRLHHAELAKLVQPAVNCRYAGPSGGGKCGTWCDNYCGLAMKNCTGEQSLYASPQQCTNACAGMLTTGKPSADDGNTVQCRIYYLGLAGSNGDASAATYCVNGGPSGGTECTRPPATCDTYCSDVQLACGSQGDPASQYPTSNDCVNFCKSYGSFPKGLPGEQEHNTLECRATYAAQATAVADPTLLCGYAGPTGGNICGTLCEVYCYLTQKNCGTYPNETQCLTACAGFRKDGTTNATTGDTVQCRTYYAGWAPKGTIANACASAAQSGGDKCKDPPSGDTCATAKQIADLPFQDLAGNTQDPKIGDDYQTDANICPNYQGDKFGDTTPDVVYAYKPTVTQTVKVRLVPVTPFDSGLFVFTNCNDYLNTCIAGQELYGSVAEEVQFQATAGTTYYIVVDGYGPQGNNSGKYKLYVDPI